MLPASLTKTSLMIKDLINKDVSKDDLEKIFLSLSELNEALKNQAKEIYINETSQGKLYKSSHYIFSIINRAIALNRGYKLLVDNKNYITAIPLLRLQVDNCLRLFALSLVSDRKHFYEEVLKGTHIRNLTDAEGKKMNDDYLVTKIDALYPKFKELYKNTSGFVHFSNEHLFINNEVAENSNDTFNLRTSIGDIDELEIHEEVDYAFNMFYAGQNLFRLINGYRLSMESHLKTD